MHKSTIFGSNKHAYKHLDLGSKIMNLYFFEIDIKSNFGNFLNFRVNIRVLNVP